MTSNITGEFEKMTWLFDSLKDKLMEEISRRADDNIEAMHEVKKRIQKTEEGINSCNHVTH